MASICWLVSFIVLLIIELATLSLVTIWFAGGALVAFFLALLGVSVQIQLITFIVISCLLLLCTRSLAVKHLNQKTTKTNVDSLIGKQAKVTELLKGNMESGVVIVGGQEWSARMEQEGQECLPGEIVTIVGIRGVTLQIEKIKEES